MAEFRGLNGRGDEIRTCDPLLPKQVRFRQQCGRSAGELESLKADIIGRLSHLSPEFRSGQGRFPPAHRIERISHDSQCCARQIECGKGGGDAAQNIGKPPRSGTLYQLHTSCRLCDISTIGTMRHGPKPQGRIKTRLLVLRPRTPAAQSENFPVGVAMVTFPE